jgi:hypothetical protein
VENHLAAVHGIRSGSFCHELLYSSPQLIASGAKGFDAHDSRGFQIGRVRYAPVRLALRALDPRTLSSRHIANGDDVIKVFFDEFINRFGRRDARLRSKAHDIVDRGRIADSQRERINLHRSKPGVTKHCGYSLCNGAVTEHTLDCVKRLCP